MMKMRMPLSAKTPREQKISSPSLLSSSSGGRSCTSISLVISKLNHELAILGATFNKFGLNPLYNPLIPSCAKIVCSACRMLLY